MPRLFPDYAYKGCALGDVTHRNHVIPVDEMTAALDKTDRNECYSTVARFTEDYLKFRKETGSVKNYAGACYIDTLWFDVDDADLENSLIGAYDLLMTLEATYGVDRRDLRCYFSGKKGFHVGVPAATFGAEPSPDLPRVIQAMAKRIAAQAGVPIDESIYRTNSLLRIPRTVNDKSGLYKIALPVDGFELLTIDGIKEMARFPGKGTPPCPEIPNERLGGLYKRAGEEVARAEKRRVELPVVNDREAEMPRFDKVCMFRMLKGVPSGHRNEVCLRLADHFRKKGLPLSVTLAALLQWNRLNEVALDEVDVQDVVNRVYDSSYDFGCHDPILDRYCHADCHLYDKKFPGGAPEPSAILTVEEARLRYQAYIRDRDQAKVSWGLEWLDEKTRMIAPGQVACLMARAGVGKTALVINAIRKNSEAGVTSLFCSLEQLVEEVWERMAQNALEMTGDAIEGAFYRDPDPKLIDHYAMTTAGAFQHAYLCEKDRLTVGQLKGYVKAAEEKAGTKIRLLVVDYLGRMKGEGRDNYQKMSDLAIGLKEVAKECECAVLVIVQVNRSGGSGFKEITMDMARDSGQIEEAVDYAVGMWREDEHSQGQGEYLVTCQINKNRKGVSNINEKFMFRADVMRFEHKDWRKPAASDMRYCAETGELLS